MTFQYDNFNPTEIDEHVILCSHYDLDGVGSTYFARTMFKVHDHYASSYPNVINNIKKGIGKSRIIVFVDLQVPDDALKLALKNYDIVYYCDHHEGSEKYHKIQEKYPERFKYLFDSRYAATKILAMKATQLGVKLSNAELEFAKACGAYDIWDLESKWYDKGWLLNSMFWKMNFWNFQIYLHEMDTMESLKDVFPKEVWQEAIEYKKYVKEYVNDPDNYELVESDTVKAGIFVFPKEDFFVNDVLLFNHDINACIGLVSGKETASVRLRIDGQNLNTILNNVMSKNENLKTGSGHAWAAGISFKNPDNLDEVLDVCYDIVEELDNATNDEGYYDTKR